MDDGAKGAFIGREALETSDDVLGLAAMQADRFPNARGPPIVEEPLEEPDADQGRGPELRRARLAPTQVLKVRSEIVQQEIRVEGLVGEAWHVAAIAANLREQLCPRGILAARRQGDVAKSLQFLRQGVANTDSNDLRLTFARRLIEASQFAEARAVLQEALRQDPANAAAADLLKRIEGR